MAFKALIELTDPVTATVPFELCGMSARQHGLLSFGTISGMASGGQYTGISTFFNASIRRKSSTASDDYADPIFVHGFDLHFQKDTEGSRGMTSK